ncbi:uncharacterized protein LOC128267272 isoform X1 [Anopheles cruzii]|uniref:uncharacterized protein LOC128267272 isoform X1 n=1 Tax=Anopheles cruzii TaxID=68878 RepID=UPI0022EC7201|nr:uncharacterized protein LOC128267272 isoform X1 [Anopheles cruzii]
MKCKLVWVLWAILALVSWQSVDGKPPYRPDDSRVSPDFWLKHRFKRQFSLNFGATHEDGYGTDVNAEALANLWRSQSGNTKVDGSATYTQHFGGVAGDGKARISGLLTFSHNY